MEWCGEGYPVSEYQHRVLRMSRALRSFLFGLPSLTSGLSALSSLYNSVLALLVAIAVIGLALNYVVYGRCFCGDYDRFAWGLPMAAASGAIGAWLLWPTLTAWAWSPLAYVPGTICGLSFYVLGLVFFGIGLKHLLHADRTQDAGASAVAGLQAGAGGALLLLGPHRLPLGH